MSNINSETVNVLRQVVSLLTQGQPSDNPQSGNVPSHPNTSVPPHPNIAGAQSSEGSTSTAPIAGGSNNQPVDEHRRLFNRQSRIQPYRVGAISRQRRHTRSRKEKSITRTMFCLAHKSQMQTPSCSEKLKLMENGLGEKRVSFPVTASASKVKELLLETYPQLKQSGGFQLLVSKEKSRKELKVVSHGSCSTEQLRCLGTGRIYIRPLQKSIPLTRSVNLGEEFEECLSCHSYFAVSEMRQHLQTCKGPTSSEEESDIDIDFPPQLPDQSVPRIDTQDDDGPNQIFTGTSLANVRNGTVETVSLSDDHSDVTAASDAPGPNESASNEPENDSPENDAPENDAPENIVPEDGAPENEAPENDRLIELEDQSEVVQPIRKSIEEHRRNAIDATLMVTTAEDEPVKVLRTFVCHFMRGRKLDITDPTQYLEGETNELFVSRSNLFEDGMDELLGCFNCDPSLPLEVTFSGEVAQDVGGPRKEFLGAMVRNIKERLFTKSSSDSTYVPLEDIVAYDRMHYFGAGLVFGYSMLQGGPLPCFMHEDLIQKLFSRVSRGELSNIEAQLRDGFDKFGLVELIKKRPSLLYLLRETASAPLTYPRIVRLLKPTFSEPGSNRRIREDRSYRLFLNYLKDVAAGRRELVTLGDVLRFATCSENEPVLGFSVNPSIVFSDCLPSCMPTANACINQMNLAIGDVIPENKDEVYYLFDYAFRNTHFGMA